MAGILIVDQIQNSANTNLISNGVIAANTIGPSQLQTGTALSNIGTGGMDQSYLNASSQYMGFKNRLINGNFVVAQRGTSLSNLGSGGANYYGLDRWGGFRGAYASGLDVSRQAGFNGHLYCMRIQRTSGNTNSTNGLYLAQVIETLNCMDLAGQTVTLSFVARSGPNYSGGSLSVTIQTSGTTDDSFNNLTSGTFNAGSFSASPSITSTGTVYTVTGTIPSNAKTIAVQIGFTPTGTAGTNDYIEITGVQLEKGSTATAFDYRSYGTELALCQRYYEKSYPQSIAPGSSTGLGTQQVFSALPTIANTFTYGYIKLAVTKRAAGTAYIWSANGTSGNSNNDALGNYGTSSAVPTNVTEVGFHVTNQLGSSLVPSYGTAYIHWAYNSEL